MVKWNNRKKYYVEDIGYENHKKFSLSKLLRKEMLLTMVSILGVTLLMLGSTFAVFSSVDKSENSNTIHVGTLDIAYDDTSTGMGDAINLNSAYPMSDEDGLNTTGYKFKITNTGSLATVYSIKIADDTAVIEADGCQEQLLDKSLIKVSINNSTPVLLSTLEESSYEIASGSLEASEEATFEIKMWITSDAGNEALAKHYHGKITVAGETESLTPGTVLSYYYSGAVETFDVPVDGEYKLEVWGAQGGSYSANIAGGKGGYSVGTISLKKADVLYIYVGGEGTSSSTDNTGILNGGFNGGGNAYSTSTYLNSSGGGATDIRINEDSLYARVIVAGGGGGTGSYSTANQYAGGYGGGDTAGYGSSYGAPYEHGYPGTATTFGNSYYETTINSITYGDSAAFGIGGSANGNYEVSGGGAGWYGGGYAYRASAGGGSGYVYTSATYVNYPAGCLLDSNYYLTQAVTYSGASSIPTHDGTGTMIGNTGNGFVKITYMAE